MGICLDTEQNNEELETTGGDRSRRASAWAGRATPPAASFPMQNSSHVKFEPPRVPVIFVLGGPGSGKVTHCDNLMQERRGLVHINMTDLLQQYAIGNDMQDFGTLSSKTVTEVLMLEMKMAPAAKTYLVSGYPRSMRDVAEYTEKMYSAILGGDKSNESITMKIGSTVLELDVFEQTRLSFIYIDYSQEEADEIQTVSGAVVVSWRQRILERQIEYGARLGHVVLSLARMELANFYRDVVPVADYYDHAGMLVVINGERNPEEVYKDFRAAVLQILGTAEDQSFNGVTDGIPGEIVGVEPAPARNRERTVSSIGPEVRGMRDVKDAAVVEDQLPSSIPVVMPVNGNVERGGTPKAELIKVRSSAADAAILWVVGGPGSNKAALCQRAVSQRRGWTHYSVGQRLRSLAEGGGGPASDGALSRAAVGGGEPAPDHLVQRLVHAAVEDAKRKNTGIVLDGYPRNLRQVERFEREFRVTPRMVLLDCSKLQLGRGRRDDSVGAFRRRLEVFRELSLPMLKELDQQHRLVIVDGDTDTVEVQEEFTRVLLEEMEKAEEIAAMPQPNVDDEHTQPKHDTESVPQLTAPTLPNGIARAHNGSIANGFAHISKNKINPMNNNVGKIPTVSQQAQDASRLYQRGVADQPLRVHHM